MILRIHVPSCSQFPFLANASSARLETNANSGFIQSLPMFITFVQPHAKLKSKPINTHIKYYFLKLLAVIFSGRLE